MGTVSSLWTTPPIINGPFRRSAGMPTRKRPSKTRITRLLGLLVVGSFILVCHWWLVRNNDDIDLSLSSQLVWSWNYYHDSSSPKKKRILVAQSSGWDSHSRMLDITQRVNRAYCHKFGYDYVALKGVCCGGYKPWHSTYDKVEILHSLVSSDHAYDGALVLDADALLVDFNYVLTDLLDDGYALTAQQVQKHPHTWDLNAGVLLWNLRHPRTKWLAERWMHHTRSTLRGG